MEANLDGIKRMRSKKSSVSRVVTDKDGKEREIFMSKEEFEMHELANA
jgi:hypothetical protein